MKTPGFGINSIPFVSKACKIFKLNKNAATANRGFKGMAFSSDVYQDICKPSKEQDQGFSWRNTLTKWQRNAAQPESAGEVKSPRTSVRTYGHPWRKQSLNGNTITSVETETNKDYEDEKEGVFTIELTKPCNGYLGLVLVGGADTPLKRHYVNDILPNSSASKSGRVKIGDELLEVNGHSLIDRTHADALTIFKSLPQFVKLVVERKRDGNSSLLACMLSINSNGPAPREGDPNITSPKMRTRKRSIMERTGNDVIQDTASHVIDVMKSPNPFVKPAKQVRRVSRCSSFVGGGRVEDEDDCTSMRSGDEESTYGNSSVVDYDDSLSFISNTSEWCAQQLNTTLHDQRAASPYGSCRGTSTISLKSLAESLPGVGEEDDSLSCRSSFSRAGSLRMRSPPLYEDQEEPETVQERPEPAMFLRKGSIRVRGGTSLQRISVIENQEVPSTWPATMRRQRSSLHWDTFVPPAQCSLRRSSSAVSSRPSSMYSNMAPPKHPSVKSTQPANSVPTRNKVQRTNSEKLIEKRTLTTQILRDNSTGDWGFTIAGGVCSPYGDLPIHVLEVHNPELAGQGLLRKGDEIVDFNGDNFEDITYLEADRVMHTYEGTRARVIIKRKHIARNKSPTINTFGNVWSAHARGTKVSRSRPESFYY